MPGAVFIPKYEDAEFIEALEEPDDAASTQRSRRPRGRVSSRNVGSSLLWMLEDDGGDR